MTNTVIMVNLLPDIAQDAVSKLEKGMRSKYESTEESVSTFATKGIKVIRYDMYELLELNKKGELKHTAKFREFQLNCARSIRILFCAHGHFDCTQFCYTLKGRQLADSSQLADFISNCLINVKDKIFNLELVICHAARTKSYLGLQQNQRHHQLLKSSFAYKVFYRLNKLGHTNFKLIARTGAVSFGICQNSLVTQGDEFAVLHATLGKIAKKLPFKIGKDYYQKMSVERKVASVALFKSKTATAKEIGQFIPFEGDVDEQKLKDYFYGKARRKEIKDEMHKIDTSYVSKYGGFMYVKQGDGQIGGFYGAYEYTVKSSVKTITHLYSEEVIFKDPLSSMV